MEMKAFKILDILGVKGEGDDISIHMSFSSFLHWQDIKGTSCLHIC